MKRPMAWRTKTTVLQMAQDLEAIMSLEDERGHKLRDHYGTLVVRVRVPIGSDHYAWSVYEIDNVELDRSGQSVVITVRP